MATVDPTYAAKWAADNSASEIASRVSRGKQLLAQYGSWIRRYRGGMPAGLAAAIMQMESDGNMGAPGDVSLGEVGFYQVTSTFPVSVGLPAESRYDPETNVFLGLLEYQIGAATAASIWKGTTPEDRWKIARFRFAIGNAGAADFINKAIANTQPSASDRGLYDRVIRFADQTGGIAYGSQSAGKVWYRVHVVDYNTQVGQKIEWGLYGSPRVIPAPAKYPRYTFPPKLLPFTQTSSLKTGLFFGALALVAIYAARYA